MYSLKKYNCPVMETELPDGRIVHLLPVTKGLFEKMQNTERTAEGMYGIFAEILSANREGIAVSAEEIAELPMTAVAEFFREYTEFIRRGVTENPN